MNVGFKDLEDKINQLKIQQFKISILQYMPYYKLFSFIHIEDAL